MGYSALLFCPEEKTARVVTQVLSELEFAVEICNEPFAAVKKMMAHHFDAIVVDCDNEQNATLLFKSARNSGSNQSSLAVAVVEGQAGVAKAFRIGANLVLTKPINVEQSKGTLRVARGLLRKGDAPKPTALAPVPTESQPVKPAAADPGMPRNLSTTSPMKPAVSAVASNPAFVMPSRPLETALPAASAAGFEPQNEPGPQPEPAEAALLESMADPGQSIKKSAGSKESSWQRTTEPTETGTETKAKPAFDFSKPAAVAAAELRPFAGSSGSAAAVAPAKEVVAERMPALGSVAEADATSKLQIPEPPTFGITPATRTEGSGGSQKFLLIAAVVILAAAAGGYFAWGKLHHPAGGSSTNNAPVSSATSELKPPSPPVVSDQIPSAEVVATVLPPTPQPSTPVAASEKAPATKPAVPTPMPIVNKTQPVAAQQPPVEPIMVKAEEPKPAAPAPAPQSATADEPPTVALGSSNSDSAISGLVTSTPVSVPKASDTIKVSQGVAQGLLVQKVAPAYPLQAMQARIQGAVLLQAHITKDGNITGLRVLTGDAVLAKSALAAVKQWKYKPYFLDGQPVEIQTQITVNFKLP